MNIDMNDFCRDLHALLSKYNVYIGADVNGDTHGVTTNFVVTDYHNNTHILNHYSSYLSASDLEDDEDDETISG